MLDTLLALALYNLYSLCLYSLEDFMRVLRTRHTSRTALLIRPTVRLSSSSAFFLHRTRTRMTHSPINITLDELSASLTESSRLVSRDLNPLHSQIFRIFRCQSMTSLRVCSIPIVDVVILCGEWISRVQSGKGNHRATLRSWSVQSMAQNSLTTSKTGSNLNRNRIMFRLETPLSCPSMRLFLVQRSKLNLNEISRNIFPCRFLIPLFTSSIRRYDDKI